MKKEIQQSHENNGKNGRGVFTSGRKLVLAAKTVNETPPFQRITGVDWKKVLANMLSRQKIIIKGSRCSWARNHMGNVSLPIFAAAEVKHCCRAIAKTWRTCKTGCQGYRLHRPISFLPRLHLRLRALPNCVSQFTVVDSVRRCLAAGIARLLHLHLGPTQDRLWPGC